MSNCDRETAIKFSEERDVSIRSPYNDPLQEGETGKRECKMKLYNGRALGQTDSSCMASCLSSRRSLTMKRRERERGTGSGSVAMGFYSRIIG